MNKIPLSADIVSEILNTSADATIITDHEGRIRLMNKLAADMFGYEPTELVGEPVEVLIPKEHRDKHRDLRERYHTSPRGRPMVSGLELRGQRKDGSTFRAEIALNPIETSDGLVVTSTIRRINRSNESDIYFRHLLESAPDAMIIVDDKGKIALVNKQAEEMFGHDRHEMLGKQVEMLIPSQVIPEKPIVATHGERT